MRVLAPVAITPAMLTSSSIAETEHPTYDAGTTYALAQRVIYQRRVWESLQDANLNRTPGASPTWWLDVGPSNRWAMFDGSVSTASTATGSITVTLTPGVRCNGLGLVAAVGNSVRVRMLDGPTVVYDQTRRLASTAINGMSAYFFATETLAGELLFQDLPRYLGATIEVTLSGLGAVSIGVLAIGTVHELGQTEMGASAGRTSYSRKETDEFGVTSLVQRQSGKISSQRLLMPKSDTRRVDQLLNGLDAVPCIWAGADDTLTFAPLVIYGWYGDFQILYEYANYAVCNLEVKGLT